MLTDQVSRTDSRDGRHDVCCAFCVSRLQRDCLGPFDQVKSLVLPWRVKWCRLVKWLAELGRVSRDPSLSTHVDAVPLNNRRSCCSCVHAARVLQGGQVGHDPSCSRKNGRDPAWI